MLRPLYEEPAPKRRRTGGWRQDRALREAEAELAVRRDEHARISKLAAGHLLDWSEGITSSAKLRFHMKNGVDDAFSHPVINRLVAVREGNKAAEDLRNLFEEMGFLAFQTAIPHPHSVTTAILPSAWVQLLHQH